MPYAMRLKRKRPVRKRASDRRTSTALRKYVKSAIKTTKETKQVCVTQSIGIPITTSGVSLSTFTPPQGNGGKSRDGNFCNATNLRVKYILEADNTDKQNVMRVMVVQSKKGLLNPNDGPGWFKCITDEARASYRVLYDRTHVMNAASGTQNTWTGPFYINIKDSQMRVLEWDPATTTNTEPNVKGAVYIFVYSSSAITPNPHILYDYECSFQEK